MTQTYKINIYMTNELRVKQMISPHNFK